MEGFVYAIVRRFIVRKFSGGDFCQTLEGSLGGGCVGKGSVDRRDMLNVKGFTSGFNKSNCGVEEGTGASSITLDCLNKLIGRSRQNVPLV